MFRNATRLMRLMRYSYGSDVMHIFRLTSTDPNSASCCRHLYVSSVQSKLRYALYESQAESNDSDGFAKFSNM